jgi:uncharacterized membrane protein YjjP (DUF1212 family)
MSESNLEQVLDLCLRAGNVMLKNGAETSRVEETIARVGRAFGCRTVHSFATPTGLFVSMADGEREKTRMLRITGTATINLSKVHEVNDLSRRCEQGSVSLADLATELNRIDRVPYTYRLRYQHLAAAISSGAFAVLFGGSWPEFLIGAICGWLSNTAWGMIGEKVPTFLRTFFAAMVGVVVAVIGVRYSLATHIEATILGAVIPLVPGVAVTNSVRDLMAGELLSGVARAAEAALTAFAIAVAVALVLTVALRGVAIQ